MRTMLAEGRICPIEINQDVKTHTAWTGAFAEFERSMIRQRIRAGLRRAVEAGKQLGLEKRIRTQLRVGKGMLTIAKALGVGTSTVQRVAREMAAARPLNGVSAAA
jgi:DNA invertase Pin-like site-specific DNA recombinase